jgi:riboflavin synthase
VFTGIVEAVGRIAQLLPRGELVRIAIEAAALREGVRVGDSIALNGVCLTVTELTARGFSFEAVKETLERSALGDLCEGARVNLERALRADGRLDGHFVQGHVDGTGTVRALERRGDDVQLRVDCGPEVAEYLVPKGSIAVDGVSLTVAGARDTGFDVALIPHTLAHTTLGEKRPGDRVNLEADVLGKYVKRFLEKRW